MAKSKGAGLKVDSIETRNTVLTDAEYNCFAQLMQYMRVNGPQSYKNGTMEPAIEFMANEKAARVKADS